jgi:hypothetical protein
MLRAEYFTVQFLFSFGRLQPYLELHAHTALCLTQDQMEQRLGMGLLSVILLASTKFNRANCNY